MPLIPAFGRQSRQISEFEASLVYGVSSRTAKAIQKNPVFKKSQIRNIYLYGVFLLMTLKAEEN